MNKYLVLSSTSLGYQLYDLDSGSISLHKARGVLSFKQSNILIGDIVSLDTDGFINEVTRRQNQLMRPRLANVDFVCVIVSAKNPDFSSFLLDKFLTLINASLIPCKIIISKIDLLSAEAFQSLKNKVIYYQNIGYDIFYIDKTSNGDFIKIQELVHKKKVAFIGQTGVGKSTLLNHLCPDFNRKVDSLFINSGRGRHTTKEVVSLPYDGGFLFDTPGFSQLELKDFKPIDLALYFPGFEKYFGKCHFSDCLHLPNSKGCQVLKGVEKREISDDSYYNYCKIYEEVKANDIWKKKL